MIKLFSLKQQKKEGEGGGPQKATRSAAQLRITKGKSYKIRNLLDRWRKNFHFQFFFSLTHIRHQRAQSSTHLHHKFPRPK